MDIDLNNIDFAIAVNTFHDDIEDKMVILNKIQLEFLRKFQHRVKIPEHHSEMIFQIRKIVCNIQEMYKDIKDYFAEMKVDFVYDFVRKIQTLMFIGYNHLSQALLITFDMFQDEKKKEKEPKDAATCTCKAKNDYITSKDQFKRLQHIDYTITSIQSQQQRLSIEMQTIYDRMILQKDLIDKVKPSLASKQLEEMKDHIQTVMQNNERLFEETYMLKFFEFHNHIKKLDKPQKITEVYNKMNNNLKDKFVKETLKAADRIQRSRRNNPQNLINVQVQTQDLPRAKSRRDATSGKQSLMKQTQSSHHPSQFSLAKQRRLNQKLSIQLNHTHKQNMALAEQLNSYKTAQKQIEVKYQQLVQKFQIVEQMYIKSSKQLDLLKNDTQWTIQKLEIQNKRIKQEISVLKGKQYVGIQYLVNSLMKTDRVVVRRNNHSRANQNNFSQEILLQQKQTQTYEQYLLSTSDNQIVKLLKNRNQKAIVMINEKDKKIRDSVNQIGLLQDETIKIKSNLNMFVGVIEEHFCLTKKKSQNSGENKQNFNKIRNQQNLPHKTSILQMNAYQIGEIIKKILKLIVPSKNQDQNYQNSLPNMENNFKKITSIVEENTVNKKIIRKQTLNDEEQMYNDTVGELPNSEGNTFNNLNYTHHRTQNSLENKKRKRISVLNLLSLKRVNIQTSVMDQSCQTNFDSVFNSTRQFQTQTNIDQNEGKHEGKNEKYLKDSQGQLKRQSLNFQKQIFTNRKKKNHPFSNRNSGTALEGRTKKSSFSKNLNTFQKFKMEQMKNGVSQSNESRFKKIGIQLAQNNKKMAATSSLSVRDHSTMMENTQTQSIFNEKCKQLSPFKDIEERTIGRFFSLLNDSADSQLQKLTCKYNRPLNNPGKGQKDEFQKGQQQLSSTLSTLSKNLGNQNFSKNKLKKYTHNRLISQMASTVRPISQFSEGENKNDVVNIAYCPHNNFAGDLNLIKNKADKKLRQANTTSTNLKADQRSDTKKKTLLLSIQKFKAQNSNVNDILLLKYLNKVVQKWGKDKFRMAVNRLFVKDSQKYNLAAFQNTIA